MAVPFPNFRVSGHERLDFPRTSGGPSGGFRIGNSCAWCRSAHPVRLRPSMRRPAPDTTLTSSCSSPLAPRRSIAFLRFPSFLRNFSAIEWNSLRLRRFLRSLGRESWQKRKMSSEPREYRRHILMEANYFISQRTGLTFEDFAADETLRRAVVRSFEIMPPQQNLWVDSGSGSRPRV